MGNSKRFYNVQQTLQWSPLVVTPLIKKVSLPNEDLQNYRPISGLCFMSRLVEWVVVKQLMQHINGNNLENPRQSAYKSGHSTETALLHIKNEIHLSLSPLVVTPLIKKVSLPNEDLQNYRPISGLCFMSRLVEWVVVKQLMQHINGNNLENPRQSAYKSGHSTETALLHIKNEIHLSLSLGKPTALVLLDLHSTQLATLLFLIVLSHGLVGFTSYLIHCFQEIKIGSTLSELHQLQFGVPQDSVLGPLLFSLYIILSKVIGMHPDTKYHFYADDTQLFIYMSHQNAALNSCLLVVQKWMSSSMLKLNPDKTEFIIFGSHAQLKN